MPNGEKVDDAELEPGEKPADGGRPYPCELALGRAAVELGSGALNAPELAVGALKKRGGGDDIV